MITPHEPVDASLTERPLSGETVFRGRLLDVRRDTVALPDGRTATREYIVHPGAVAVVALLDDGRLVVERQYRYPLGRVLVEIPAGKIDPGEATLRTAMRELAEETGYRATEWARAGLLHNAVAYATEGIEIWFARGLTAGPVQRDEGEFMQVQVAGADELAALALAGDITDAKTLIALAWLEQWRAGRRSLAWQSALGD